MTDSKDTAERSSGQLISYRHKFFLRILRVGFLSAAVGFVLVLAAGHNVDGLLARVGVSIALIGVLLGFVAFIVYTAVLVRAFLHGRHGGKNDEKSRS